MAKTKLDPKTLRWVARRLKRSAPDWYNSVTPGMGTVGFHVWSQADELLAAARDLESAAKRKASKL